MLRCVLLGLNVKLGKKDTKTFKAKFKDLVQEMQIELIMTGQEILSEVFIRELKYMRTVFDDLEYYEELKKMFAKCDVVRVEGWIQGVLEEKKTKFKENKEKVLPFISQESKQQIEPVMVAKKKITIRQYTTVNVVQAKEAKK